MLDLFGSKRRAILNSEQFQKNIVHVKDLYNLILKMSDADTACKIFITCDDNSRVVSFLKLTLTTHVNNSMLRYLLNTYYENFCLRKIFNFQFNYDRPSNMTDDEIKHRFSVASESEEKQRKDALERIGRALFRDQSSFSLYENYRKRHGTDIYDFVYTGFGMSKSYVVSEDDYIPFSINVTLKTGLSDEHPNGRIKSEYEAAEERNFYSKILLDELSKI